MNEIEAMQVERILRAAHRVAKRAVMDARTADAPASGLWAASGGTGRENTSLVAKFTVKRKNGTKQSGLTIPQVQKMVGIYGHLGQQLSMLKKGRALKTPNGDFITRDARTSDALAYSTWAAGAGFENEISRWLQQKVGFGLSATTLREVRAGKPWQKLVNMGDRMIKVRLIPERGGVKAIVTIGKL